MEYKSKLYTLLSYKRIWKCLTLFKMNSIILVLDNQTQLGGSL